jgi:hypothetical protein
MACTRWARGDEVVPLAVPQLEIAPFDGDATTGAGGAGSAGGGIGPAGSGTGHGAVGPVADVVEPVVEEVEPVVEEVESVAGLVALARAEGAGAATSRATTGTRAARAR